MLIPSCRLLSSRNWSYILLSTPINVINSTQLKHISDGEWIINSISLVIFVLALLGNTAALLVMFGSRGPIRLTNNKYLVNLACADLLRASFMPFTIIARMKRNFMFGPVICKVLPVIQGLSVAVDVFTLVCISVERYIAICRPLLILKLQSLRFANFLNGLILFLIWTLSLLTALPNLPMYHLCSLPKLGRFKCEKVAPVYFDERIYMVLLDIFYFLAPMLIMLVLYTLIICKMYKNNTALRMRSFQNSYQSKTRSSTSSPPSNRRTSSQQRQGSSCEYQRSDSNEYKLNSNEMNLEKIGSIQSQHNNRVKSAMSDDEQHLRSSWPKHINRNRKRTASHSFIRQASSKENKRFHRLTFSRRNSSKSRGSSSSQGVYRVDRNRRKALKLLIVIIVEFFICWTPLYIYHTFGTFDKKFYRSMPTIYVDLILLFSFASLLSNPFTYYFMSKRYRTVLYAYLSWCSSRKNQEKFNQSKHEAQQMVKALRLHQQENVLEYKQKVNKPKASPNHLLYHPKFRSYTLQ